MHARAHARTRKFSADEALARDEGSDAFPPDDSAVIEIREVAEGGEAAEITQKSRANEPICLACGGSGSRHDGCDHAEVARLHEPSRAAGEIIDRLQKAAAEHRAASRALRALVTSELSRGRAELETKPAPPATPSRLDASSAAATEIACPRCAERETDGGAALIPAVRANRKRGRAAVTQESLPFTRGPVLAAGAAECDDEPGERTIERLPP
jgi:hypothetical protein